MQSAMERHAVIWQLQSTIGTPRMATDGDDWRALLENRDTYVLCGGGRGAGGLSCPTVRPIAHHFPGPTAGPWEGKHPPQRGYCLRRIPPPPP